MMPLSLCRRIVLSAGLVAACGAAGVPDGLGADPIDELVQRLSGDPLWENGIRPNIRLPRSAGPDQVAVAFLKTQHAALLELIAIRNVRIPGSQPDRYTAVLVDSSLGRKIILMRPDASDKEPDIRWNTRMFNAH